MKRWIRIDERMGQRLRWTGLLISLILLSSGITPAHAHANLVRSEPEANAVLDTPPTQIRLWFSETPEPGFSQIQLLDRSGAVIPGVGSLQADPSDSRLLWLRVPILTPASTRSYGKCFQPPMVTSRPGASPLSSGEISFLKAASGPRALQHPAVGRHFRVSLYAGCLIWPLPYSPAVSLLRL